jgi:hypothetical protein
VCKYLGLDELDAKGHTELKKQRDLSTAWTMAKKINASLKDADDEEMGELVSDLIPGGYKITPKSEIPIITADFTEWAPTYTGPKFNFIHCDFPYGINTDKRQQGNIIDVQVGYDDGPEMDRTPF